MMVNCWWLAGSGPTTIVTAMCHPTVTTNLGFPDPLLVAPAMKAPPSRTRDALFPVHRHVVGPGSEILTAAYLPPEAPTAVAATSAEPVLSAAGPDQSEGRSQENESEVTQAPSEETSADS